MKTHAILVGTNTVIADNSKLNVRTWSGENPIRIVLDKNLRIEKDFSVFDESVKTIFLTEKKESQVDISAKLIFETIDFSKNIGVQICEVLYKHQIQSVIIEGGLQTLQTFINENLWDEARVFIGETEFKEGIKAPVFNKVIKEIINIKTDVLKLYTND